MESISVVQGSSVISASITKPFGSAIALILLNNHYFIIFIIYFWVFSISSQEKKISENIFYVGI